MKKLIILGMLLITASMAVAQNSGLGFNYQAVVRRTDGILLANSEITLRVSLYPGQNATTPTWVEIHNTHTDNFGTFGITVGKGIRQSNSVVANYKDINFAAVYYWMKIEIEEGATYKEVSYSQLPSAPYSEVANNASMFAGMIAPFAGPADKIPNGWLLCDGREVRRMDYLNLYNAIGVCWGEGDGNTTFNLPDLRGMFLRGVSGDSGYDPDADKRTFLKENGGNTGNNVGSYQGDAIRNITGKVDGGGDDGPLPNGGTGTGAFRVGAKRGNGADGKSDGGAHSFDFNASRVVPVGSDNRPKNVYVTYIIKY